MRSTATTEAIEYRNSFRPRGVRSFSWMLSRRAGRVIATAPETSPPGARRRWQSPLSTAGRAEQDGGRDRSPRRADRPSGPRAARGGPLPGVQPARGAAAGVRRAGGGAVPRRRRAHGGRRTRRRAARALPARLLPAPRRPEDPDPLPGGPHPRRPLLHHPPGGRHTARRGDLPPLGVVPRPRGRREPPGTDAQRPRPRNPAHLGGGHGPLRRRPRRASPPAPSHRRSPHRRADSHHTRGRDPPATDPPDVAARRRSGPRRPAAAHLPGGLRQRHDPPRHGHAPPRPDLEGGGAGEPGPRHVVPPPL